MLYNDLAGVRMQLRVADGLRTKPRIETVPMTPERAKALMASLQQRKAKA